MPPHATTIRRAKAQYRKSGPQITPAETRRIERSLELDRRAKAIHEKEERKRQAEKAKVIQERRERDARRQIGIGLATQLAGYSHSQKRMKGGMEGWLGVKSVKVEKKENDSKTEGSSRDAEDVVGGSFGGRGIVSEPTEDDAADADADSFGSTDDLEDMLLAQTDQKVNLDQGAETDKAASLLPTSPNVAGRITPTSQQMSLVNNGKRKHDDEDALTSLESLPVKKTRTSDMPDDNWQAFLETNTQIQSDILLSSSPHLQAATKTSPLTSSQEFELGSDDLFDVGLSKAMCTPEDGVSVRDFAYDRANLVTSISMRTPGAPRVPRNFRDENSMRMSFGRPHASMTPPSKMTATCGAFTAAQCSFSTNLHDLGFSTQVLQDAIDAGDDDTEDEDEEVYSKAIAECKVPDNVLMPPPPIRTSPTIFKPPGPSSLFAAKGGLHIFGLSTQILQDAILASDDGDDTDEDEDGGLFSVPIHRTVYPARDVARTTRVTKISPENALPTPDVAQYEDFGLSTQVLKDALSDEVLFTDDDDDKTVTKIPRQPST